ncbi:MAG: 1-acyl-sn-glycerol-3-phosphate acyltransferase [Anaerolineae bacterium]|nr:1-acyl-sn-glycerol-3-phosphate acyltransferase [Anaerolineae bacterium]
MTTSDTSFSAPVHTSVERQERYTWRRRFIRDVLLRQIGFRLLVKVQVEGLEHIPAAGPTLLAINHISAIDPFVVTGAVRSRFLVPMSKVENYRNPLIRLMADSWGVYPIRRGEVDRQALASTLALLKQDYPVLIAPEGTRNPALIEAKDGMSYIATKADAVIVPVGVEGTHEFPGSLKRLRRAPVTVRFGSAFRFRTEGRKRIPRDELHYMTVQAMYQIALLLPEYRRGFYNDLSQVDTGCLEFLP